MKKLAYPTLTALSLVLASCEKKPLSEGFPTTDINNRVSHVITEEDPIKRTHQRILEEIETDPLRLEEKVFKFQTEVGGKEIFIEVKYDSTLARFVSEIDILKSDPLSSAQMDRILERLANQDSQTNKALRKD